MSCYLHLSRRWVAQPTTIGWKLSSNKKDIAMVRTICTQGPIKRLQNVQNRMPCVFSCGTHQMMALSAHLTALCALGVHLYCTALFFFSSFSLVFSLYGLSVP